jgi:hypothetical protein
LPVGRSLNAFVDVYNVTNRANFDDPPGDRLSTNFLNLTALRAGAVPTRYSSAPGSCFEAMTHCSATLSGPRCSRG